MRHYKYPRQKGSRIIGLLMIVISLIFMIVPHVEIAYKYHLLDRGKGQYAAAVVDENQKIQDGKTGTHYSYELKLHFQADGKTYYKDETYDTNGVYKKQPATLRIGYLPSDPTISALDVSGLGLDNADYVFDKEVGGWMVSYFGYWILTFGLLNLIIGFGLLPTSWVWGKWVTLFGILGAIFVSLFAGGLLGLTALIINAF